MHITYLHIHRDPSRTCFIDISDWILKDERQSKIVRRDLNSFMDRRLDKVDVFVNGNRIFDKILTRTGISRLVEVKEPNGERFDKAMNRIDYLYLHNC